MKFSLSKINKVFNIFLLLVFLVAFLQLDETLSTYISSTKSFLILIYLGSLAYIIYENAHTASNYRKEKKNQQAFMHTFSEALIHLNHDEKHILSLFVNEQKIELNLNSSNPAVQILEHQKLIIDLNKTDGNKKTYRIQPNVYRYLRQNPKVLY